VYKHIREFEYGKALIHIVQRIDPGEASFLYCDCHKQITQKDFKIMKEVCALVFTRKQILHFDCLEQEMLISGRLLLHRHTLRKKMLL
jgi:hypothetical protein